MNFSWGLLIAIVYVVIHVVSFLVKEAEKKKRREREMEEAERRRIAIARMEMPTALPSSTLQPSPVRASSGSPPPIEISAVPSKANRADEIAARRKLQLEQLRMRAGGTATQIRQKTTRPQSGQVNPPPPSYTQSQPDRAPEAMVDVDRERRIRMEAKAHSDAKARELDKARSHAKSAATRARQQRLAVEEVEEVRPKPQGQRLQSIELSQNQRRSGSPIAKQMQDRKTLRNLIILKEILDPPVGMR